MENSLPQIFAWVTLGCSMFCRWIKRALLSDLDRLSRDVEIKTINFTYLRTNEIRNKFIYSIYRKLHVNDF